MRELILHIGLPKTGTSYLQQSLVANADRLRAAGLGVSAFQDPRDGDSRPFRRALATRGIEAVMDDLAATPGERVILSSEQLSDWLDNPGFAAGLHRAASRHFAVRILIFLRRQDFLKESLFAQVVKRWYEGDIAHETHYDYDHAGRISRLERAFGRPNIRVALYHDQGPNDIMGALLRAAEIDLDPGELDQIGRQNVSLHRRKVLFLSQVPKPDPDIQDLAQLVTRVLGQSDTVADDGIRFVMPPANRRELVARHQLGNEAIVRAYGLTDVRGFACLPDTDEDWTPARPTTLGEIAATQAEAIAYCLRELRPRYAARMIARVAAMAPAMARRRFAPRAAPRSPALPAAYACPHVSGAAPGR